MSGPLRSGARAREPSSLRALSVPKLAPIAIGVAGAGYFGRFHALKVAAAPEARLVGVSDPDTVRAGAVSRETGAPALAWPELLRLSEALIIAAPVPEHFRLAALALGAGKHVLVEKPIAATLDEAKSLADLARRAGRVLQVGHLERFSAAFQALTALAPRPLYIEAVRAGPFKLRGTDVSVILDLMIHDLDLVLALVGQSIATVDAFGLSLASAHADFVSARLHFANGCVASLTANRIAERTERRMRIIERERSIALDFASRTLSIVAHSEAGEPLAGSAGLRRTERIWEEHDSLAAEHAAFRAAIRGEEKVLVDAEAGTRALAAALAVSRAISSQRTASAAANLTSVL